MVGFGPTVWSSRRGETEYGVKAIPLGGYIRMIGMFPPDERRTPRGTRAPGAVAPSWRSRRAGRRAEVASGRRRPALLPAVRAKRLIMMFGGPFMNLSSRSSCSASSSPASASPVTTDGRSQRQRVRPAGDQAAAASCRPSDPAAPADAAGLRAGDDRLASTARPSRPGPRSQTDPGRHRATPVHVVVRRDGRRRRSRSRPSTQRHRDRRERQAVTTPTARRRPTSAGFLGRPPTTRCERQSADRSCRRVGRPSRRPSGVVAAPSPQKLVGVVAGRLRGGRARPERPDQRRRRRPGRR